MGYLDLLEPYYNWVIPRGVIAQWGKKAGFTAHQHLIMKPKSSYHVMFFK
jgi:hypothetical protein